MNRCGWTMWAACLYAGVAVAQTPLSLDAAVAEAMRVAPQVHAQLAAREAAKSELIAAGRLPAPELVGAVENLPANGADAWSVNRDFMTMRKLGVMQSFGNGRRRAAERTLAEARAGTVAADLTQARVDVSLAAAQAWISVWAAERKLRSLEQLQPAYALQSSLAVNAIASGKAGSVEALEAKAEESELHDRLLLARQQVTAARADLARWIADAAEAPLADAPAFDQLPDAISSAQAAIVHHAEIRAFDARIDEARAEADIAASGRRPDWSTEVAWAKRGTGYSDMLSFEVRVSVPLFAHTRVDPVIAARRATVLQRQSEREAAFNLHSAEYTTMLAEWRSSRERLRLYDNERLPLARQRTAAALAALSAGTSNLQATLAALRGQQELELVHADLEESDGRAWAYLKYLSNGSTTP